MKGFGLLTAVRVVSPTAVVAVKGDRFLPCLVHAARMIRGISETPCLSYVCRPASSRGGACVSAEAWATRIFGRGMVPVCFAHGAHGALARLVLSVLLTLASAGDGIPIKENWQDVWRTDVTKCTKDNLAMFTDAKGKQRTRRLEEMTKIIADRIVAKTAREEAEKRAKESKAKAGQASGRKLSKKERMKQELSGHLGQMFGELKDSSAADAKKDEEMYQAVFQQGEQMIHRIAQQAKLPMNTEVTLREWCDMAWRAGRFSPLDPDKPKKEEDFPDEDAEASGTKSGGRDPPGSLQVLPAAVDFDAYITLLQECPEICGSFAPEKDRKMEISRVIDELASKSDVRNPSAFVSSTIAKYPMLRPNLRQHNANLISGAAPPRSIYEVLQRHPGLEKALDAIALRRLEEVDIDRAADLLDDLAQRRGVRNPSAFIVHVLGRSTPAYDEQEGEVDRILQSYPHIRERLDSQALMKLSDADPGRVEEILQDMDSKGDVRNPSAFIVKALSSFPAPRHDANLPHRQLPEPEMQNVGGSQMTIYDVLDRHPGLQQALDASALQRLEEADFARAADVIEELALRPDVRNCSAFVVQALRHAVAPTYDDHDGEVDRILLRYPAIRGRLDSQALMKLADSDPARVEEILQDMDSKGDVRNPSAFIVKALSSFPAPRHDATIPNQQPPEPEMQKMGNSWMWQDESPLHQLLSSDPGLREALDDGAMRALEACDPERALEVVEDIIKKGDAKAPYQWNFLAPWHTLRGTLDEASAATTTRGHPSPLGEIAALGQVALVGVHLALCYLAAAHGSAEGNIRGTSHARFLDVQYFNRTDVDSLLARQMTHDLKNTPRLRHLRVDLEPIFRTLAKTPNGGLSHQAAKYALFRFFLHERSWLVKGIWQTQPERLRKVWESWVPSYLQQRFEEAKQSEGASLDDLVEMIAVIEDLVQQESRKQMAKVFESLDLPLNGPLSRADADMAVDMYLLVVLTAQNLTLAEPAKNRKRVGRLHRTVEHGEALRWLRHLEDRILVEQGNVYDFASISKVAEAFGLEFPSFNDKECSDLKARLVSMEGGSRKPGRIPLTDFYGSIAYRHWNFSESPDYLRDLGVLDESDPHRPHVILANYITSYNNCMRTDGLYAICCRSVCGDMMSAIEEQAHSGSACAYGLACHIVRCLYSQTKAQVVPVHPRGFACCEALQHSTQSPASLAQSLQLAHHTSSAQSGDEAVCFANTRESKLLYFVAILAEEILALRSSL
ncbi:unnamed protein product [Symbiodinium sp. CCMP2592]|nr:unnamed protein product [Symbiodinium sp. CCMP2592]